MDNKVEFPNIGCVIMASGMGKRFGGNKLMADFMGRPMICRILDGTDGIFGERIVVTRSKEVLKLCEDMNIKTIFHQMPDRNDTIRLGLQALSVNVEYCMFCQSDQPLLSKDTICKLAAATIETQELIYQLKSGDIMGSPIVFPKWAFEELKSLPQKKGGNIVVKKYPERVKYVEAKNCFELMDIDTKEDMEKLKG
jgi:molybdenum cofactor cytidylyltransferase